MKKCKHEIINIPGRWYDKMGEDIILFHCRWCEITFGRAMNNLPIMNYCKMSQKELAELLRK